METRPRRRRYEREETTPSGNPQDGGGIDPLRRDAGQLLATADDLIRRTLTGDSERFLRDHRQMGGE